MDMIGKIRRMHRRDKKTKREISRATGLSRNTVAKWLDEAQPVEPKYRREAAKATKLSAHGQGLVHADQGSGLRRWLPTLSNLWMVRHQLLAAKGWCACKQAWVLTPTEN